MSASSATAPVHLRIGTTQYLHTMPLIAGAVSVPGVEYQVTVTKTIDECTLKTLAGEFDAGEFSLATYIKVCEAGGPHADQFIGLPVFAKKLVSQYAFCRADDNMDGHASLAGKRIAVPQFWVTAAIWHRLFIEAAGVDPASVTWCPLGKDRIDGMPYPDQFKYDWSLVGKKQSEVIRSGEADCFIFARRPFDLKGLRYLSRNPIDAALETVKRTGIIPVTHVLAVRRELLQQRPDLAQAIYSLFAQSLAHGDDEVGHHTAQFLPLADMQLDNTYAALGEGWNGYGWQRNEKVLRAFCAAAVKQGFVKAVDIDRIFNQSN